MSVLSHQSFANTDTPYWASASKPTSLVSPLSVIDTYGVPTKKTTITANANGTGGVFYSGSGGGNPFGLAFAQGATQPSNQISLDVGNTNPVLTLTSSNVVSTLPVVVDSPLNAQNFAITPTSGGVQLTMGGAGGGAIQMTNSPSGAVTIMSNTTITPSTLILSDGANNNTNLTSTKVQFGNGSGQVAQVGITGSSAYLGTNTAPLTTPGVLVNIANGAELQFADSANVYGMKSTSGVLNIGSTSVPAAIAIQSNGLVDIPNLALPATINATTINATTINSSNVLATAVVQANQITAFSSITSTGSITAVGSANMTFLNSNSLATSNMIQYVATPTATTGTTGSPGVWLTFLTISVSSNLVVYPTLDFHLPPISIAPNNPPNANFQGGIGVVGTNVSLTPLTFKNYRGVTSGTDCIGSDCFVLRRGVDYNAATASFTIYVIGYANNPEYNVLNGTSNVMIRAFPF